MEELTVDNIHDMPIEHHLNKKFTFECIDFGDRIRTYSYDKDPVVRIELCIISEEPYIFKEDLLSDLITSKNISFMSLNIRLSNESISRYKWILEEKCYCKCMTCGYKWEPEETEHYNFTCCELCGGTDIEN